MACITAPGPVALFVRHAIRGGSSKKKALDPAQERGDDRQVTVECGARRGAGAAERGRLEICCPSYGGPWVRIPPSPPGCWTYGSAPSCLPGALLHQAAPCARMIWTAACLLSSRRPFSPGAPTARSPLSAPVVGRRLPGIVKELPDAKQSVNNATLRSVNCESKQPSRRLSYRREGSISEAAPRAGGTRGKASRRERRRSVNHPSGPAGAPAITPASDLYNRTEQVDCAYPSGHATRCPLRAELSRTAGQGTPRDGRHRPFG
jgi:hypothetical protein